MRTVSIRELSGTLLETASAQGEILGITNAGALAGVLVPMTQRAVQQMAQRDAYNLLASVQRARDEIASGEQLDTLSDFSNEPSGGKARPNFTRISIRELSGARIEEASAVGETLLVTKDRVVLGLLVPVTQEWVERLIESSITRFLGGETSDPVTGADPGSPGRPSLEPQSRLAHRPSKSAAGSGAATQSSFGRESLQKRAIGIKIIADAPDGKERLVGVVTDILGSIIDAPIEIPLPSLNEGQVFAQILTMVDKLCIRLAPGEDMLGVGIEIGGHVHEGRVIYSANAHWDHFPLADRLADALDLPVILENDANALAVYERWFHGIDDDRFAVILVTSLGVGSGLVLDGRVYRGSHGMAGELGHIPVEFNDRTRPKCRCENPGCLEGVATPQAIALTLPDFGFHGRYEDALQTPDTDPVRTVFTMAGSALGRAIANIINILNPSAIVLHAPTHLIGNPRQFRIESAPSASGGVARHYMDAMLQAVKEHSFSTGAEDCLFIVRTSAEEHGAAAAATCLIRRVAHSNRSEPMSNLSASAIWSAASLGLATGQRHLEDFWSTIGQPSAATR
jgi:predicted NBD/HSP70 family sugar kinase